MTAARTFLVLGLARSASAVAIGAAGAAGTATTVQGGERNRHGDGDRERDGHDDHGRPREVRAQGRDDVEGQQARASTASATISKTPAAGQRRLCAERLPDDRPARREARGHRRGDADRRHDAEDRVRHDEEARQDLPEGLDRRTTGSSSSTRRARRRMCRSRPGSSTTRSSRRCRRGVQDLWHRGQLGVHRGPVLEGADRQLVDRLQVRRLEDSSRCRRRRARRAQ